MNIRRLLTAVILLCLSVSLAVAEEVTEICRLDGFVYIASLSADPTDGSCLVADYCPGRVVRVGKDCTVQWVYYSGGSCEWVSVNASDGSCWVADGGYGYQRPRLIHLAADGTELLVLESCDFPVSVSVNPTDGSFWTADIGYVEVRHLAGDGTELWWGERFGWPYQVEVNPADGSCWVADWEEWAHEGEDLAGKIVHLAEDGTELLRIEGFAGFPWISVIPADGSCWVTVGEEDLVMHLAEDGTELWRGTLEGPSAPFANQADGSCWVGETRNQQIVHLAADGTELWRGAGFWPGPGAVDSVDGSCWAHGGDLTELVHLMIPGWRPPIFYDVPPHNWAFEEVEACCRAGIVAGYPDGLYHPTSSVSRAQMAVFISRALAGGDENVAAGPDEATFEDVPTGHWAYRHVEYCFANDVVQGFSPLVYGPDEAVSRDAMAVFISRAVVGGDENIPPGPAEPTFEDVPTDYWAYKHIEYAVSEGIVQGYDPFTYAPTVIVSRDQMAVFICRAFDLPM